MWPIKNFCVTHKNNVYHVILPIKLLYVLGLLSTKFLSSRISMGGRDCCDIVYYVRAEEFSKKRFIRRVGGDNFPLRLHESSRGRPESEITYRIVIFLRYRTYRQEYLYESTSIIQTFLALQSHVYVHFVRVKSKNIYI